MRRIAFRASRAQMKQLMVFDLDGTLAESKSAVDDEMSAFLGKLLTIVKVAIISGGDWPQFEKQLLSNLSGSANLRNLSLLPTCGTKFYNFDREWKKQYSEDFSTGEKNAIIDAFQALATPRNLRVWGDVIEDRGSQITFSALGQLAPLEEKRKWDPDFAKRLQMKEALDKFIPDFSVRLGGTTSVDVTRKGIDKAYGIRKLRDILGIKIEEMIFVGDAIFPGGNDYPAKEAGVYSIRVRDPNETKRVIEAFIGCLDADQPTYPSRDDA
jgi:phosphomannomutase